MTPIRHFHDAVGWEIVYWLALLTMAGSITLLLAIRTAGG
jgi:hypothetical protein